MAEVDPKLVAEWNAAEGRARKFARSRTIRQLIAIAAGLGAFYVFLALALVLLARVWRSPFEMEQSVRLMDNLQTLVQLLLVPVVLVALPVGAAVLVARAIGYRVFFRR